MNHDDTIHDGPFMCPGCERPNQFGQLCDGCQDDFEADSCSDFEATFGDADDLLEDSPRLDPAPWKGEFPV